MAWNAWIRHLILAVMHHDLRPHKVVLTGIAMYTLYLILLELVLALHEEEIDQHQRIDLYHRPVHHASYFILIGLENPLSDSVWNNNLALGAG